MAYTTFASESVCAGHPDKLCDQISDAILDAALDQDPHTHAGIETAVAKDHTLIFGEITTTATIDYEQIARTQIKRLGYTNPDWGFTDQSPVRLAINQQSPEIALGVDSGGAGDQGMMFGYACRETPELMPLPITLAHALTRALDEAAATTLPYLRPNGKAQVVVRYEHHRPIGIQHVTIAKPHSENTTLDQVKHDLIKHVITPVLGGYGYEVNPDQIIINGTGIWHQPSPTTDAGLTGRKIVVDTYGGYAHVGGGAFSGKDPTKLDRSGAYAARYIAKNLVATGLADRAEVALAYVIGQPKPVMQDIHTFGTAKAADAVLREFVTDLIDTSVHGITRQLDLLNTRYLPTAAYGHFGRPDLDLPWEQIRATLETNDPTTSKSQ